MDKFNTTQIVLLCIAAVLVIISIYVIVSLIVDHVTESKKSKEIFSEVEMSNSASKKIKSNKPEITLNKEYEEESFYSKVNHFTDTGRAYSQDRYNNASTKLYNDVQFVIVKSVIHTETREELVF